MSWEFWRIFWTVVVSVEVVGVGFLVYRTFRGWNW